MPANKRNLPRVENVQRLHSDSRRVLYARGVWQPEWRDLYVSKGCDGLRWRWESRAKQADLAPLEGLPGLKMVELKLRGVDDRHLARLTEVEELSLWSNCSVPLDLSGTSGLLSLGVERSSPVILDGHETLESLWVSGWRDEPLRVPSAPELTSLRVEGAPGGPWIDELRNLDSVPGLASLWLDRFLPATLEPVSWLSNLEDLDIASHPREAPEHVLDLEPLRFCSKLKHLRISNCRVRSLEVLRDLPNLITLSLPVEDRGGVYEEIHAVVDRRYHSQPAET